MSDRLQRLQRIAATAFVTAIATALGAVEFATAQHADPASPELYAALASDVDLERGRVAYQPCQVCHGEDGAGLRDGTFPQLAGQHSTVIIKQLIDIRSGRRENPLMLQFVTRLIDAQEIADVAAWLAAQSPPADNGVGEGNDLDLGERVYQRDCARCHGASGRGDAEHFIPAIAGQHYGYLLRQIRDIGAGRRGNAHPEMAALANRYDDAELKALVDYASRLRKAPVLDVTILEVAK